MSRRPVAADWESEAKRYEKGETCVEIAERIGCAPSTVSSNIRPYVSLREPGKRKGVPTKRSKRSKVDWARIAEGPEDCGPLIDAESPVGLISRMKVGELRGKCVALSSRLLEASSMLEDLPSDCTLSAAMKRKPASLRVCVNTIYETNVESGVVCSSFGMM